MTERKPRPLPRAVVDATVSFVGTMLLRIAREEWEAEQEAKRHKRKAA